jgi:hypothetical protein
MNKLELNQAVEKCRAETKEALQTVYDTLNHGQQKQIVKDEKVKALFDLYDVESTL